MCKYEYPIMDLNIINLIRTHVNDRWIIALCCVNHTLYQFLKIILSGQKQADLPIQTLNCRANLKLASKISYARLIQHWFLCVQSEQDLAYLQCAAMTNLKLSLCIPRVHQVLPSYLQHLKIAHSLTNFNYNISTTTSQLKSFTLHCERAFGTIITIDRQASFFEFKTDREYGAIFLSLPLTLDKLIIRGSNIQAIKGNFDNIKHLHLARYDDSIKLNVVMEYLHIERGNPIISMSPGQFKLHTLILPSATIIFSSPLPESLIHLDISNYRAPLYFSLPSKLKYLSIHKFNSRHAWPKHLESLKIRDCDTGMFAFKNIEHMIYPNINYFELPSSIRQFNMIVDSARCGPTLKLKQQLIDRSIQFTYDVQDEYIETHVDAQHIEILRTRNIPLNTAGPYRFASMLMNNNNVFVNLRELHVGKYQEDKIDFKTLIHLEKLYVNELSCAIQLHHIKSIHINQASILPSWCGSLRTIELKTYNVEFERPFPSRLKRLILPKYDRVFTVPLPLHLRVLQVRQLNLQPFYDVPDNIREIITF